MHVTCKHGKLQHRRKIDIQNVYILQQKNRIATTERLIVPISRPDLSVGTFTFLLTQATKNAILKSNTDHELVEKTLTGKKCIFS